MNTFCFMTIIGLLMTPFSVHAELVDDAWTAKEAKHLQKIQKRALQRAVSPVPHGLTSEKRKQYGLQPLPPATKEEKVQSRLSELYKEREEQEIDAEARARYKQKECKGKPKGAGYRLPDLPMIFPCEFPPQQPSLPSKK